MARDLELAIKIAGKLDSSLAAAVSGAQKQLDSLGKFSSKAMSATIGAVAAGGAALLGAGVKEYMDYESSLNNAAAVGNIEKGTAEYQMLDDAAREAGRTTVKTAQESADALSYMMLAGWNAKDSVQALPGVLKLSAATGADLATTSDLVTDSMANLGLGVNDLNRYLNVSAAANNKTNQTATQLQEAYLGVGGVLNNLNSPIEESAAILGVLANRGTKGSEAGTALNAILVNMQKKTGDAAKAMSQLGVSMYDGNGKARSLIDVFQEINDKTAGMTEEQRNLMYQMIGGKSHVDSFAKIMAGFNDTAADGQKEVYSLKEAFENSSGALENLYNIKTDTLEGSLNLLKSAFSEMLISIGEKAAPALQNIFKTLADKMPEIQSIILNAMDSILPVIEKVVTFLSENIDSVIHTVIALAEAFAAIKVGSGLMNVISFFEKLKAVAQVNGIEGVINSLVRGFTGLSATSGVAGAITSIVSAIASFAGPALAAGAAAIALGAAIKGIYNAVQGRKLNFADGMEEQAQKISDACGKVTEYNNLLKETQDLRAIMNNPDSSEYELANAKQRLEEIAQLLEKEYNLKINADTTELEKALKMAKELAEAELSEASTEFFAKAPKAAKEYASATQRVQEIQAENTELSNQKVAYQTLQASASKYRSEMENGTITNQQYLANMNELYNKAKESGLITQDFGAALNNVTTSDFIGALTAGLDEVSKKFRDNNDELTTLTGNMREFAESAKTIGEGYTNELASATQIGDTAGIESATANLMLLGNTMTMAGISTQQLAMDFATASAGYNDFQSAIDAGKVGEMTQSFISFQQSVGASGESIAQGAALIANGFQTAQEAAAAGGDAINAVLNDMLKFGNMQGIFDGLDTSGIAQKLTEMAHAMNLIPDNKVVRISAEGNLEVVDQAENKLNNIDGKTANANANVNTTGAEEVEKVDNALNNINGDDANANVTATASGVEEVQAASEAVANADKSATMTVTGNVTGMDEVQNAAQAGDQLQDKTVSQTVNGSFPGQEQISTALEYQNQLQNKTVSQTVNGVFNGQSQIATALEYQNQLADKTVTYTVNYVQNGNPPANNATGTDSFVGGLTYVNDQNISDPREVIEYGGSRFWFEGRDVLTSLPRGARIYTASQSRAFIDGSHKNGLTSVPFDGYVAELHAGERVLTKDDANDYGSYMSFGNMLDSLKDMSGGNKREMGGGSGGASSVVFSPNITINGEGDKDTVTQALKMSYSDFKKYMNDYTRDIRRRAF